MWQVAYSRGVSVPPTSNPGRRMSAILESDNEATGLPGRESPLYLLRTLDDDRRDAKRERFRSGTVVRVREVPATIRRQIHSPAHTGVLTGVAPVGESKGVSDL